MTAAAAAPAQRFAANIDEGGLPAGIDNECHGHREEGEVALALAHLLEAPAPAGRGERNTNCRQQLVSECCGLDEGQEGIQTICAHSPGGSMTTCRTVSCSSSPN
jgi:hypothetical protein